MVQVSDVAKIRRRWEEKGEPPCDHPDTDREYDLGGDTGDRACLTCGDSWPRSREPEPGRPPEGW